MYRGKTLRILGQDWTIEDNAHELKLLDRWAQTVYGTHAIETGFGGVVEDKQREIMLHEVLHALSGSILPDDWGLTESQVLAVAPVLLGFMLDNPKFMKWLLAR